MDGQDLDLFERSVRHATESHTGAALDAALDELGWPDAMRVDRRAAISTLFRLQGETNATSSALGAVVAGALALECGPTTGVVLPAMGRWAPPGLVDGHGLHVAGLATTRLAEQELAVVAASMDGEHVAITVAPGSLGLRPIDGLDPRLGLVEVTAAGLRLTAEPEVLSGDWAAAVALGRTAVAHELVGASTTMLALACEHALGRVQFGRPISTFQAVRHRLAETLVAIEMAEAVLDAAWLDGSTDAAAMAKAVAGRQARTTARHCQQVLAGIGFTTEHPLHRYLTRALVIDGLFGTASSLTRALGEELVAGRQLPPLLPL